MNENNSHMKIHKAVLKGNIDALKTILNNKEVANLLDANKNTPLHIAMVEPKPEIIKLLLDHKANPNIKNPHKVTPLHLAACKKDGLEAVLLLIKAGAKINRADKYGNTPLHIASRYGHKEIVEALIHAGANINAMNNEFQMPLSIAKKLSNKHCATLLEKHGATLESAVWEIIKFSFKTLPSLKRTTLIVFSIVALGVTLTISVLTSGAAAISVLIASMSILGMIILFVGKQYFKIRTLEKKLMNDKITLKQFLKAATDHTELAEK